MIPLTEIQLFELEEVLSNLSNPVISDIVTPN